MSTTPPDARTRLLAHFSNTDPSQHGERWNELWKEKFVPWDKGFPSPALVDLLGERQDILPTVSNASQDGRRLRALVPGCGKGYDVLLLSAFGYDTYGLDTADLALEQAKEVEKEMDGKGVYETREGVKKGSVNWVKGDFFKEGFGEGVQGKFDLIYDYTFLSALPPSLRPAWSKRYSELLSREGRLVCLEFPTYKPPSTGGPPWALPPKIYTAHLPRPGEELAYGEDGSLLEDKLGPSSKNSLQRIEHFRPKRTHEIGYNEEGEVTDRVGVWAWPK